MCTVFTISSYNLKLRGYFPHNSISKTIPSKTPYPYNVLYMHLRDRTPSTTFPKRPTPDYSTSVSSRISVPVSFDSHPPIQASNPPHHHKTYSLEPVSPSPASRVYSPHPEESPSQYFLYPTSIPQIRSPQANATVSPHSLLREGICPFCISATVPLPCNIS